MKKFIIAAIVLVALFIGIWVVKTNMPVKVQEPTPAEIGQTPWWEVLPEGETPTADPNWVLDPEIPENYIPVLNADELYMVIEDGKIAEEGTYEELIEKGGSFARLVERQRLDT